MKKFLRNLVTPGSFASGIAMLTSGAGLGQLFLFLSSPILMRLYPPAVFGELAILISFTSIVAIIVTLRFEAAIPISDNDHTAHELIFIALFFATSFAMMLGVVLLLSKNNLIDLFNLYALDNWLMVIPFNVVMEAGINTLGYWHIRKDYFFKAAMGRTWSTGTMVGLQILLAPLVDGNLSGMIIGFTLGQVVGLSYLFYHYLKSNPLAVWRAMTPFIVRSRISDYRQFPLYASWNSIFNTMARQAPPVILGLFFPKYFVGQYAAAMRLLNMPFNLLGNSVGQAYYQRIFKLIQIGIPLSKFTQSTMWKAGAVVILPLLVIAFYGRYIFTFVLGSEWEMAGTMAEILVPIYFTRFISGPVSNIFPATKRQQYMLVWQLALALVSVLTFYLGGPSDDILFLVKIYSWLTAGLYVVLGAMVLYYANNFDQTKRSYSS